MKRACPYCGKIHDSNYVCEKKPVHERGSRIDRFRWTQQWKDKREYIKKRDMYMCAYCIRIMNRLVTEELSVHHIQPLKTNWDKRLDDSNLITLCSAHHEEAEKGAIPAADLIRLVPPTS